MKFLKICCFIILITAALGQATQASNSNILKKTIKVEESFIQDKKPKTKQRKKFVIKISEDVGYVITTIIFDSLIEVCKYYSGCSTYNHR